MLHKSARSGVPGGATHPARPAPLFCQLQCTAAAAGPARGLVSGAACGWGYSTAGQPAVGHLLVPRRQTAVPRGLREVQRAVARQVQQVLHERGWKARARHDCCAVPLATLCGFLSSSLPSAEAELAGLGVKSRRYTVTGLTCTERGYPVSRHPRVDMQALAGCASRSPAVEQPHPCLVPDLRNYGSGCSVQRWRWQTCM